MKKIDFIALVFLMLAIPMVSQAKNNALDTGKSMGIFQSIGLAEDGYIQSYKASLGKTKVTKDGAMTTRADNTFDPSDSIYPIPHVTYSPLMLQTQSSILNDAKSIQAAQVNALITQIKNYIIKKGAVEATFYYRQLVHVQGSTAQKALIWQVLIDATGRAKYSDPKIINEIPQFVHLIYTPLKIEAGLPSSWIYPDAGKYSYKLVDKLMNPITASTTVDTAGAYDMPVAQTTLPYTLPYPSGCEIDPDGDMVCDPEWSLKCLIDKTSNASCPTSYKDIKKLIDETGSDGAYVDYVSTLSPVYDQVLVGYESDGVTEIFEDVARVSISVDLRKWVKGKNVFFISPGGGGKFQMKARVGYELLRKVDRYQVNIDGTFNLVGSEASTTISPTTDVDKTVSVPKGTKCVSYSFNIINPFSDNPLTINSVYDYRNDTVNRLPQDKYIYVAPLSCY